jgi:hypothetical protein
MDTSALLWPKPQNSTLCLNARTSLKLIICSIDGLCRASILGVASERQTPVRTSDAAPFITRLSTRKAFSLVAALLFAFLLTLWPLAAYAGTITVAGACTLPDAITAANNDATFNSCTIAGAPGTETILLPALTQLGASVVDANGQTATPSVVSTIVISGGVGGATVERNGIANYRLFHVGAAGNLTLENVTVRYGYLPGGDGGALYNLGSLTLRDSTIFSNTAGFGGGFYSNLSSNSTLVDSRILSNTAATWGGGIFNTNNSTTIITGSVIARNTSGQDGGGLFNTGASTATLADVEISANTAVTIGGGLVNTVNSVLTLADSHVLTNTARDAGGLYNDGNHVTHPRQRLYFQRGDQRWRRAL